MRVLVVRLSSLGDVVDTLPVACALRDHDACSFVGWVVEEPARFVLEGHSAIDELIVVPPGWIKSQAARRRLAARLRSLRFDVAVDVQSLTRSAVAAKLSGAPRRIGLGGRWWQDIGQWFDNELFHLIVGREASRWFHNERVEVRSRHVVDAYLELLAPLGIESPKVRFDLPIHQAAAQTIDRWLRDTLGDRPFVMINPSGSMMARRWPVTRFAEVARHLDSKYSLPIVIPWMNEQERSWAEEVAAATNDNAWLPPPTTLAELAALISKASAFISNDTGPLHMAWAIGTPCVGLYGDFPAFRNGPYGAGHIAVERAFKRGNVFARRRNENGAMRAIAVADVNEACDRLVDRLNISKLTERFAVLPQD